LKLLSTSNQLPGIVEDINISMIFESKHAVRLPIKCEVEELAKSISEKGLLNPIIVRQRNEYAYEIVAGNRRHEACKLLGYRKIACQVIELDDKGAFEISLIENIQRKTLYPMEEARAFKKYISEFGWGGASELSQKIGKSVSYITKKIRLLELPPEVIDSVISSAINTSTAEELLFVKDKSKQSELARLVSNKNLSVRETRDLLNHYEKKPDTYAWLYCSTENKNKDSLKKNDKVLDRSISVLRIAMTRLSNILSDLYEADYDLDNKDKNENEVDNKTDNWMLYEMLLHHKNMLHQQVDHLIKEKCKRERNR
jgi:ParB family chromosome partitioning protein